MKTDVRFIDQETGDVVNEEFDVSFVLPMGCIVEFQSKEYIIDSMKFVLMKEEDESSKTIANVYIIENKRGNV